MNRNGKVCRMPEDALQFVIERFPFKNYINTRANNHLNIAKCVRRHLTPGAKILDFGSGPCDKTAILQVMGFECSAYDDLQDAWHVRSNNQDKIQAFAESIGIHFTLAKAGVGLAYPKAHFDMLILNDVLEHLHDSPRELLNNLLELVKPNGLVLVTVPNAGNIRKRLALMFGGTNHQRFDTYYWYPGQWRGHVREYVKDDLWQLSKYLGLDVLELHGCDQMLHRVKGVSRPVYVGVTSIMRSWKDSWIFVARKRPDWRPQRNLPPGTKISRPTEYLYGE